MKDDPATKILILLTPNADNPDFQLYREGMDDRIWMTLQEIENLVSIIEKSKGLQSQRIIVPNIEQPRKAIARRI